MIISQLSKHCCLNQVVSIVVKLMVLDKLVLMLCLEQIIIILMKICITCMVRVFYIVKETQVLVSFKQSIGINLFKWFFSRIDDELHQKLPNLKDLYLTNCEIRELSGLDSLVNLKNLEFLSLMRNPVANKKNYRLYIIHKIPQIRVLDFQRVKLKVIIRASVDWNIFILWGEKLVCCFFCVYFSLV